MGGIRRTSKPPGPEVHVPKVVNLLLMMAADAQVKRQAPATTSQSSSQTFLPPATISSRSSFAQKTIRFSIQSDPKSGLPQFTYSVYPSLPELPPASVDYSVTCFPSSHGAHSTLSNSVQQAISLMQHLTRWLSPCASDHRLWYQRRVLLHGCFLLYGWLLS